MAQETKLHRKELKEPDQFIVAGGDFLAFLTHNKTLLLSLLGALVLIAGGFLFVSNQKKAEISRMEGLYFQMTQKVEDRKGDVDSQLISDLKSLLDQFNAGIQQNRAQLLLADIYFQAKNYDEAIKLYQAVSPQAAPGSIHYSMAHSGMAHAYESQNDYKNAIAHFKLVIDHPGDFPLFYSHLALARCYEKSNDSKNAVLVLREMETSFPKHADLEKARLALKRLEGSA